MTRVLIDIPDYNLDEVQNGSIACGMILNAVKNGTVLPKGHGDLIDRKALRKAINEEGEQWVKNTEYDNGRFDGCDYIDFLVANAPTIIEADKDGTKGGGE